MRARDAVGIGLIAAVLAAGAWLLAASPRDDAALRMAVLDRPTPNTCAWSQPWADPAFTLIGWSEPEPSPHDPASKLLWSNARDAQLLFHLPPVPSGGIGISLEIAAVAADVTVQVNGRDVGTFTPDADASHAARSPTYTLPADPADGIIDVGFRVRNAELRANDGRYLGVLLKAVRACPAESAAAAP